MSYFILFSLSLCDNFNGNQAIPEVLQIFLFSGYWTNIRGGIQTNLLSELPKYLFLCIHTEVTFGCVLQILEGKITT